MTQDAPPSQTHVSTVTLGKEVGADTIGAPLISPQKHPDIGFDSTFLFTARLTAFFTPESLDGANFNGIGLFKKEPDSPAANPFPLSPYPASSMAEDKSVGEQHSRVEQECFIGLFWELYHPLMPILHKASFDKLFDSLWTSTQLREQRDSSPLPDIVVALGVQHAYGSQLENRLLSLRGINHQPNGDVSLAGITYFLRCREAIHGSSAPTSLTVIQCYALIVVYLLNASQYDTAYHLLGVAIRSAHSFGLHSEPKDSLLPLERELRKRAWWQLYILDIECSTGLGWPVAVQAGDITCSLPSDDDRLIGRLSDRAFHNSEERIGISQYFLQSVKRAVAISSINRATSWSKFCSTLAKCESEQDMETLESRAECLAKALDHLDHWRATLPKTLYNLRRSERPDASMSKEESSLALDPHLPSWLQRQRICLELAYHNALLILQRPFISFPRSLDTSNVKRSRTDEHARSSLQHSIIITIIIHDVLSDSDLLYGWYDILRYQWNSVVTMLGFVLANPLCSRAPGARQAMNVSLQVFDMFAPTHAFAMKAANLIRVLCSKLDDLIQQIKTGMKLSDNPANLPCTMRGPTAEDRMGPSVIDEASKPVAGVDGHDEFASADDDLRSWMNGLDSDSWLDYQNGLGNFLNDI